VRSHDLLDRDQPRALEEHERRDERRHGDLGEPLAAGLAVAQEYGDIQRQRRDVRERMRVVNGERRQHRIDPPLEQRVELGPLVAACVLPTRDGETTISQCRQYVVVEYVVVLRDEFVCAKRYLAEQLVGAAPGHNSSTRARCCLTGQRCDSDAEELVEQAGEDGQQAHRSSSLLPRDSTGSSTFGADESDPPTRAVVVISPAPP
jgi:hypothetical protein